MNRIPSWLGPAAWAAAVAALVGLGAAGLLGRGLMNDLWYVAYAVVLASAWNILGGFAGQVSFGYSAFVGIGAYAAVLLALKGWNPYLTLPVGAALAVAFSVAIGLPTFRLRGPYFTIATIGVSEAVRVLAQGLEFTGGSAGKRMPPGAGGSFVTSYAAMLALAGITVLLCWWIQRSRFGLGLRAIRQDIDAAEALGVNATRYKVLAHALSAALVAVAGGLYAINFQYIAPNSVFAFTTSLSIVLMPVIGGVGTVAGPVVGGVVFSYIQNKLLATLPNFHLLVYGLLLIVVMLFEPGGLAGLVRRLVRRSAAAGAVAAPGGGRAAPAAAVGGDGRGR